MSEFFEIAKTDFSATFEGGHILLLLIAACIWILWQEKNMAVKILTGILPIVFMAMYWCPVTGQIFIKALGEDTYWRILWLLPIAVTIPYAGCLLLKRLGGPAQSGMFIILMMVIMMSGKNVLSEEWFEPSQNVYKLPQDVIQVGELLPTNVHVCVSNRLLPYMRQYDPNLTMPYGRIALGYAGLEEELDDSELNSNQHLYLEMQKSPINVQKTAMYAKQEHCTFLVFSNTREFDGDWNYHGFHKYGETAQFVVYVNNDYVEGEDARRWLEFKDWEEE